MPIERGWRATVYPYNGSASRDLPLARKPDLRPTFRVKYDSAVLRLNNEAGGRLVSKKDRVQVFLDGVMVLHGFVVSQPESPQGMQGNEVQALVFSIPFLLWKKLTRDWSFDNVSDLSVIKSLLGLESSRYYPVEDNFEFLTRSNVEVKGGSLQLIGVPGTYPPTGVATTPVLQTPFDILTAYVEASVASSDSVIFADQLVTNAKIDGGLTTALWDQALEAVRMPDASRIDAEPFDSGVNLASQQNAAVDAGSLKLTGALRDDGFETAIPPALGYAAVSWPHDQAFGGSQIFNMAEDVGNSGDHWNAPFAGNGPCIQKFLWADDEYLIEKEYTTGFKYYRWSNVSKDLVAASAGDQTMLAAVRASVVPGTVTSVGSGGWVRNGRNAVVAWRQDLADVMRILRYNPGTSAWENETISGMPGTYSVYHCCVYWQSQKTPNRAYILFRHRANNTYHLYYLDDASTALVAAGTFTNPLPAAGWGDGSKYLEEFLCKVAGNFYMMASWGTGSAFSGQPANRDQGYNIVEIREDSFDTAIPLDSVSLGPARARVNVPFGSEDKVALFRITVYNGANAVNDWTTKHRVSAIERGVVGAGHGQSLLTVGQSGNSTNRTMKYVATAPIGGITTRSGTAQFDVYRDAGFGTGFSLGVPHVAQGKAGFKFRVTSAGVFERKNSGGVWVGLPTAAILAADTWAEVRMEWVAFGDPSTWTCKFILDGVDKGTFEASDQAAGTHAGSGEWGPWGGLSLGLKDTETTWFNKAAYDDLLVYPGTGAISVLTGNAVVKHAATATRPHRVYIQPMDVKPGTSTIVYEFSPDGGTTWYPVTPTTNPAAPNWAYIPSGSGTTPRVRVTLNAQDAGNRPTVQSYNLYVADGYFVGTKRYQSTNLGNGLVLGEQITLDIGTHVQLPSGTSIAWFVSSNGGVNFTAVMPGGTALIPVGQRGTDIRVRADLTTTVQANTPTIFAVSLLVGTPAGTVAVSLAVSRNAGLNWHAITSGTTIDMTAFDTEVGRKQFQIRATLTTTSNAKTPLLFNVNARLTLAGYNYIRPGSEPAEMAQWEANFPIKYFYAKCGPALADLVEKTGRDAWWRLDPLTGIYYFHYNTPRPGFFPRLSYARWDTSVPGSNLVDLSGNGRNATGAGSPAYDEAGPRQGTEAWLFSGQGRSAAVNVAANQPRSFFFWYKPTSAAADYTNVTFMEGNVLSAPSVETSGTTPRVYLNNGAFVALPDPVVGRWQHYGFTWSPTQGIRGYYNGRPFAVAAQATAGAMATIYLMSRGGSSRFASGYLFDPAFFDRALTDLEVDGVYNDGQAIVGTVGAEVEAVDVRRDALKYADRFVVIGRR